MQRCTTRPPLLAVSAPLRSPLAHCTKTQKVKRIVIQKHPIECSCNISSVRVYRRALSQYASSVWASEVWMSAVLRTVLMLSYYWAGTDSLLVTSIQLELSSHCFSTCPRPTRRLIPQSHLREKKRKKKGGWEMFSSNILKFFLVKLLLSRTPAFYLPSTSPLLDSY